MLFTFFLLKYLWHLATYDNESWIDRPTNQVHASDVRPARSGCVGPLFFNQAPDQGPYWGGSKPLRLALLPENVEP